MPLVLIYVIVAAMALIVTVFFMSESIKMNVKGVSIILSVALLAILCLLASSHSLWHIPGLILLYVVILRVTVIIWNSKKNLK